MQILFRDIHIYSQAYAIDTPFISAATLIAKQFIFERGGKTDFLIFSATLKRDHIYYNDIIQRYDDNRK